MISHFISEEEGQTLVEYGLLISLLALVVITALTLFGSKLNSYYGKASNQMPN